MSPNKILLCQDYFLTIMIYRILWFIFNLLKCLLCQSFDGNHFIKHIPISFHLRNAVICGKTIFLNRYFLMIWVYFLGGKVRLGLKETVELIRIKSSVKLFVYSKGLWNYKLLFWFRVRNVILYHQYSL